MTCNFKNSAGTDLDSLFWIESANAGGIGFKMSDGTDLGNRYSSKVKLNQTIGYKNSAGTDIGYLRGKATDSYCNSACSNGGSVKSGGQGCNCNQGTSFTVTPITKTTDLGTWRYIKESHNNIGFYAASLNDGNVNFLCSSGAFSLLKVNSITCTEVTIKKTDTCYQVIPTHFGNDKTPHRYNCSSSFKISQKPTITYILK